MGVERVDYYSDDEYRQALIEEEREYREQWERQAYEENIAELEYNAI